MNIAPLAMLTRHTELIHDVSLSMMKKAMDLQQGIAKQGAEGNHASHPMLCKTINISV